MSIILNSDENGFIRAKEILDDDGVIIFPTETVYGIGANAFSEIAVNKIFDIKGRPKDNPLIVHIGKKSDINKLVTKIPGYVKILIDKFWPGPLTLILESKNIFPLITTANLDTVGIRMPRDKVARKLLEKLDYPLAAPSANLSKKPSCTTTKHVLEDFENSDIGILAGDDSEIGIESTVLLCTSYPPVILREGAITEEMIVELIGDCLTNTSLEENQSPLSPGQKYGHYMPSKKAVLIDMDPQKADKYLEEKDGIFILTHDNKINKKNTIYLSDYNDLESACKNYFKVLRDADRMDGNIIYIQALKKEGVGKALYNRMLKSVSGDIIKEE